MALYPRAHKRLISRYAPGGSVGGAMSSPRRLVLHTAVSDRDSLFDLFNTPGNAVAHFYIDRAGNVEQYVDTARRASAVLDGNHDCITVETWDGARVIPWTDAQLTALKQLAVWVHKTHGIPLQPLSSSRPGTRGIGVHRQGIDGNFSGKGMHAGRVVGGEKWSLSFGKMCPLDVRITQTVRAVIPGARQLMSDSDDTAAKPAASSNVVNAIRFVNIAIRDMANGKRRDRLVRARNIMRRVIGRKPKGK